jgi:hypothetical protein
MPERDDAALSIINLRGTCRRSEVLPVAGALMEQPALLMECFDVVDAAAEREAARQQEEALMQREKDRMELELKRGRGRGR